MKRFYFVSALAALVSVSVVRADVNVGDTPKIDFKAADGTNVSLAKLHGKIVIVDFWATWCGPCMAEAPHMVQINQTYSAKGLQIIGISLDQDQQAMIQTAKAKGFTWPQYFDGQGWQNKYAVGYGVQGIPYTMLIGPDGKVLWSGHPGGIDAPLQDAFKNHPPQLVDPKVLTDATQLLDQAQDNATNGDARNAVKLMAKVPAAARQDSAFAAKFDEVAKKVDASAEALLAEVDPLIKSKNYVEAAAKLKDLTKALGTSSVGQKARAKLSDLMAKPEVKSAINSAEKNASANAALEEAQKLKDDKKDSLAYPRFKQVVAAFPGTPAAATAADAVKEYEQDSAFMAQLKASGDSTKAKAALSMADNYRKAGNTEAAKAKYQQVVDQFPGSTFADRAQRALTEMASE